MKYSSKKNRIFLAIGFSLLFFTGKPLFAADAILTWDPNPEAVSGYKVYYGTASGTYGTPIDAGNQTTYTVTNLSPGTYYFAVTATFAGMESGFSNEVSNTITGSASPGGQTSSDGGGCAMVVPVDGGSSGSGQAVDMLAILGVILAVFIKKRIKYRLNQGTNRGIQRYQKESPGVRV